MPETTVIRRAVIADATMLAAIGRASYADFYGAMWHDAAAYAAHLASFGTDAMRRFLARGDTMGWLALSGDEPVGFLLLAQPSADPVECRPGGAELYRIYLLRTACGQGVASELVAEAENAAKAGGARYLWLDAMVAAPWAWQTYEHWGFRRIGTVPFAAGRGAIADDNALMYVLTRDLAP